MRFPEKGKHVVLAHAAELDVLDQNHLVLLLGERLLEVGGRVGGGEMNAVAALHQGHRQRGGDGGFAHATLAHDHDEPAPGGGQFIREL